MARPRQGYSRRVVPCAPLITRPERGSLVAILILGFVPAVIFAWAFELTPEGVKREKEVNRDTSITHVTAKKLDFVTIGMLAAVLVVVAVDRFLPQSDSVGGRLAAEKQSDRSQGELLQEGTNTPSSQTGAAASGTQS